MNAAIALATASSIGLPAAPIAASMFVGRPNRTAIALSRPSHAVAPAAPVDRGELVVAVVRAGGRREPAADLRALEAQSAAREVVVRVAEHAGSYSPLSMRTVQSSFSRTPPMYTFVGCHGRRPSAICSG